MNEEQEAEVKEFRIAFAFNIHSDIPKLWHTCWFAINAITLDYLETQFNDLAEDKYPTIGIYDLETR